MLKQKYSLAKLREEFEGRRRRICRNYKRFGHLVQNCKNKKRRRRGENQFPKISLKYY